LKYKKNDETLNKILSSLQNTKKNIYTGYNNLDNSHFESNKDSSLDDSSTMNEGNTSSSSKTCSSCKEFYINFEEIDNFDIFQDFDPKTFKNSLFKSSNLEEMHKQEGSKENEENSKKLIKRSKYFINYENSKKLSLPEFEINRGAQFKNVEIIENKPGNYDKYVKKVFKSMKNFDLIDFRPLVEERIEELSKTSHKYTLILDLDETLIHSDFTLSKEGFFKYFEFYFENEPVCFNLFLRPGVEEFLDFVKSRFEVIVFTASKQEYADWILNYLDPENNIFKHRFYRENCISVMNKIYIKDLRIFNNRNLENMLIIDNSLYSFSSQLSNGILISSFYNNENDRELYSLMKYLNNVYLNGNLIETNKSVFDFENIKRQILLN